MVFSIDTGTPDTPALGSFGSAADHLGNGAVTLTDPVRADRFKRQTLEAIWAVDTPDDLDLIQAERDEMLESLFLNFPDMWDEIDSAFDECRAIFAGAAKPSAPAGTDPAEPGNSLGIVF